jgi:hypothetical protein
MASIPTLRAANLAMENPIIALFQLINAFKAVGIDYVVVGSVASSVHGDYRTSADIDVVADISKEQVRPLVNALRDDFYLDDLSVSKAIAQGRSFNVIHLAGIFKVDVFLPASDLSKQQLARREVHSIDADGSHEVWIATAEDTILAKLHWYRLGEEVSELQWRDVKGILGTQGSALDFDYLRLWAERVGVLDLLERAVKEIQ